MTTLGDRHYCPHFYGWVNLGSSTCLTELVSGTANSLTQVCLTPDVSHAFICTELSHHVMSLDLEQMVLPHSHAP